MSDKNLHQTLHLSIVSEQVHKQIMEEVEKEFGSTAYFFYVADWSPYKFVPIEQIKDEKFYTYYSRDLDALRVEIYDTVEDKGAKVGVMIVQTGEGSHGRGFQVSETIHADLDANIPFKGYSENHEELRWAMFSTDRPYVVVP